MNMDEWFVKLGDFIYPLPNEVYLDYKPLTNGEPQCEKDLEDGGFSCNVLQELSVSF